MDIKAIARQILPPIVYTPARKLLKKSGNAPGNGLFDGDDALFKSVIASTKRYGEYGCGASTIWVAQNTQADISSVDTSLEWINLVRQKIEGRQADLQWVDCGEVAHWGTPSTFQKRSNFSKYPQSLWGSASGPDTVLVDGRFRVSCFLTTLKSAAEGTRIIFDDYMDRPHYHVVEEFVPRTETCGRQCLFIVPAKQALNIELIEKTIEKFEYVMG
jgi:hypothetical protein